MDWSQARAKTFMAQYAFHGRGVGCAVLGVLVLVVGRSGTLLFNFMGTSYLE